MLALLPTLLTPMVVACASDATPTGRTTSVPPGVPPGEAPTQVPAPVPAHVPATVVLSVDPAPTGVPGLDAVNPLCAAWAAYVGTLQALGIAASFGNLAGDQFAALELRAAPRLVDVTLAIDAAWPPELAAEHDTVVDRRIGPFARRARHAVEVLTAAGFAAADLGTLSSTWQTGLSTRDEDAPIIDLAPLGGDLQAKLDAATATYDAAVTPFPE
ncbi:MAG: hypothetical protein ABIZ69_02135, partial [Ilumatobacteraceae bacterium]